MSQQAPSETSSEGQPAEGSPAPDVAPVVVAKPSLARRWWRSRPLAVQLATALGIVIGAVPLLLYIANAEWSRRHEEIDMRLDALRRAELATTRLATGMANMQSGARAYLVTRDSSFLEPYELGRRQLRADLDTLRGLVVPGSAGAPELAAFALAMDRWLATAAPSAPLPVANHPATASLLRAERLDRLTSDEQLMDEARSRQRSLLSVIHHTVEREQKAGQIEMAGFERDARLIRLLAMLVAVLLVVIVARVLSSTLRDIVTGASALASGDYEGAKAASGLGGSREARQLSLVFDRLSLAIAEREQILQSDILQLKELELLKRDFVSTVSHELRTPLTAIRGALALVLAGATGPLSAKSTELLQIANQNTQRLIRLINDILDIEKMEGGHVEVQRAPCDLAGVLHATIAGVRALADEAGVRLRVNAPERPTVDGDPDKLVQVFTNLISNAIKFSPAGREVRVQLSTSDSTAIVSIADQGPGIPPEFRDRIFGKFQQAAHSGTRTTGGTGLGLAIARAIVDLHGGTIRFESRHGAGTTFIVELPYAPAREVRLIRERPDLPYLLIVEPEAATRDALALLCSEICEVVTVRSTEEALSALSQATFDTIILDPDVSGRAGLDVVRALRESPGHGDVPVLLFAVREYSAGELAPLRISPRDVVVKTVDRERTLVDRLLRALRRRPQSLTTTFGRD